MESEKIQRINELSRIGRERELAVTEKEEQHTLRQEYITGFRENMRQILDSVRIQEPDGTVRALKRTNEPRHDPGP